MNNSMKAKPGMTTLQRWIDLLGISAQKLRDEFPRSRFEEDPDSTYGRLTHIPLLRNKDALFYFDKNQLILIHIHSKKILATLDGRSLLSELGTPEAELRSPSGKGYIQHVFPERGIALSSDSSDRISFVEIFKPMSLDEYRAHLYVDPGPFIR